MKFYNKEMYIIVRHAKEWPVQDGYPDVNEEYFMSAGIFETISLAKDWLKSYVTEEITRRKKYGHNIEFIEGTMNRRTGEYHYIGWKQIYGEVKFFVEPVEFHEDKDGPF